MQDRAILDISIDKELFFKETAPAAILALEENRVPDWGIMSPQHMLEHLMLVLKFATGEIPVQQLTPPEKLQRQLDFLFSPYGMPMNFKAAFLPQDKTIDLIFASYDEARTALLTKINAFLEVISQPGYVNVHPYFGPLDKNGWLQFQYKHFMHHFMQFRMV